VRWRVVLVAVLLAAGCSRGPTPAPRSVRVAAAADLKFAFPELIDAFRAEHADIHVNVTYGASGVFFAQLVDGAPFDLFLSADLDYPKQLVERGRGVEDSVFVYAEGHLVVWVPNASPLDLNKAGLRAVAESSVRRLAIANPRHAPYGRTAEAALKRAGLYEQVKDRLVLGGNVAEAAQFVESGAADAGLIALSLAVAPPLRDRGRHWEVPADEYPRLEQGGVIVTGAADVEAARALREFLTSDKARAVFKRYGLR
jgi:molybdate transport system substrate-binding protein